MPAINIIIFSALSVPEYIGPLAAGEPTVVPGFFVQPYEGYPEITFKVATSPGKKGMVVLDDSSGEKTSWQAGELITVRCVRSGDVFLGLVPDGTSIVKGSMVMISSASVGMLKQVDPLVEAEVSQALGYALEDVTASGSNAYIKILFL